MTDWKDPIIIAEQAETLVRYVHILSGLYLWEFIVTFHFEWELYTGKRPFKLSLLVYVMCRWLGLFDIVLFLVVFNVKKEIDCAAAMKAITGLAHSAIGLTSALLVLRAVALNGGRRIVSIPLTALLLLNWATLLHGISVADGVWIPEAATCSITHSYRAKLNLLVSFFSDLFLLVVSIVGLIRQEGAGKLWNLLFKQGLIYFALSLVAYSVPTVFLLLNLNDVMNYMFEPFAVVVMTICATRMYRQLSEFVRPVPRISVLLGSYNNYTGPNLPMFGLGSQSSETTGIGNNNNNTLPTIQTETITESHFPGEATDFTKAKMGND